MMFQNFYPNKLIRSVYELNWEELSRTYGGVIFDIDNTLVPSMAQRLTRRPSSFCPDPQPWHEDHAGIQQRRSAGKSLCTAGTD